MVESWLLSLWGRRRATRNPPQQIEAASLSHLGRHHHPNQTFSPPPRFLLFLLVLILAGTIVFVLSSRGIASSMARDTPLPVRTQLQGETHIQPSNHSTTIESNDHGDVIEEEKKRISHSSPLILEQKSENSDGPYHNLKIFTADYKDMLQNLKIYVYPTTTTTSLFPNIFQPIPNPGNPNLKLGNYFSEHAFKTALFQSPLLTDCPEEANFFFMPFSINAMRNDPRIHSGASIVQFVANYTSEIASKFPFWNASGGSDHLYVCCHSIGRDASAKHFNLHNNAIQVACSSSYFQRLYVTHKDVPLAQVWPRPHQIVLNLPHARKRLAFFAGRKQNSRIRQRLLSSFGNDASMDIFPGNLSFPYEEGFCRSKYCLHVAGYEVNTARISDSIHYGCIPVIISDYYDLPFTNVLDWSKFSIIISQNDIDKLKDILLSISKEKYETMYMNLGLVRKHFAWHMPPRSYDSFFMTAYQLWLRRGLHRIHSVNL